MNICFSQIAWQQYVDWQKEDVKILRKINALIKEISRTPYEGTGKPEALRNDLSGYWSRRIDRQHRLVYKIDDEDMIIVVQCRYHY